MSRLVDVPPQRVYGSAPLLLPLIKMSDAEEIWMNGQPQIYDKDYPLDYSGLNFSPPWWADTGVGGGLSGVGGGNVRLMPHEMAGFAALGLTAAQQKAQAAAAARKQVAQQKAAAKAQAKAAKKSPVTLPIPPATTASSTTATSAGSSTAAKAISAAAASKQQTACTNKGGTWNSATNKCTTAAQQTAINKAQCATQGGTWSDANQSCGPGLAANCQAGGGTWANGQCTQGAIQTQCTQGGGTWANGACTPGSQQVACQTAGGTWANNACTPSSAQTACLATNPPGIWANGQCTPGTPVSGSNCAAAPSSCPVGLIIGTDINGCQVCVTDPNYANSQAQVTQCQQQGGYWTGTYCQPPQQPYAPGAGGSAPIPPGFDDSGMDPYGDPTGGGAPPPPPGYGGDPSQGYGPPGAPPNQSGQYSQYGTSQDNGPVADAMSADGTDTGTDSGDGSSDTGSTDDTSKVSDTNIFESISKLFSGMNGLACGCDAAPAWFNTGLGGNAPKMQVVAPSYYTALREAPVEASTTDAVIGGALVLMVGAAAVFLWSKGTK